MANDKTTGVRKVAKWKSKWAILVIAILLAAALIYIGSQVYPTTQDKTVSVYIKKGSSLIETAETLSKAQAVKNKYIFIAYAYLSGKHRRFYPGKYIFNVYTSYSKAVAMLAKGPKKIVYRLTIPEGFTLRQIKQRVVKKTSVKVSDFEQAVQDFQKKEPSFGEGYLFPETYFIAGNAKAKQVVDKMYSQFKLETKELKPLKNYSFKDLIIVASLVEAEAQILKERIIIAAVIYNRLEKGMKLEVDATVQYALPGRKKKLNRSDLKVESPYNTYLYKGLPPTPICSPGKAALRAAANPAQVDYLYYVLVSEKSGKHYFTKDYEDFLRHKRLKK